jgi:hypothetical protein
LVVAEPDSESVRAWLSDDDHIVTWAWTRTEIIGAIERRTRDGVLSRAQRRETLGRFDRFADSWDEITDVLAVRARANALLARHPLRAADAGQLGTALLVDEQFAGALTFVCLDARLALAAEQEGLRIAT